MSPKIRPIDERIHSIENKIKSIENLLAGIIGSIRGDGSSTIDFIQSKLQESKNILKSLEVKSDDPYFNVIGRPTLVVIHDPTEGKAKVIGYFAGIHPITYKILVCRRVIKENDSIKLIDVKELPLRKDHIVNKNLEESTVIILDPLYNESGFLGDKEIATLIATLTALKSEVTYLKSELSKYKYLSNFFNQELQRMGEELTKLSTQVSVYESERSRLMSQLRVITGKLQSMYNYVIELEQIAGERYKASFESMKAKLNNIVQLLQETYRLEIDSMVSTLERIKNDVEVFKSRLSEVQPEGTEQSEEINKLKDTILSLQKKILELESKMQEKSKEKEEQKK